MAPDASAQVRALRAEAAAHAGLGDEVAGAAGVVLQLAAELRQVLAEVLGLPQVVT
jgi:hypothetical protein